MKIHLKKCKTGFNFGRPGSGRTPNAELRGLIRLFFTLMMVTALSLPLWTQETQEKKVKKEPTQPTQQDSQPVTSEYVEVSNAEVVVRAFRDGKPVSGLTKSDFVLYEDGDKQPVTSFLEIRRKIGLKSRTERAGEITDAVGKETTDGAAEVKKTPPPKRLFFFYLRVSGGGTGHEELLNAFFKDIYRPGDTALLTVQNKVFKITNEEEAARTLPVVLKKLAGQAETAKLEHQRRVLEAQKMFKSFEEWVRQKETPHMTAKQRAGVILGEDMTKGEFVDHRTEELWARDLELAYRQLWGDYRFRKIHMDTGKLKAIASSLKRVNMQKWGIVYYQTDRFPQFNPESLVTDSDYSMTLVKDLKNLFRRMTTDMRKPLIAADIFDEVRQAFVDANATFHLLLSEPPVKGTPMQTQHIRVERIRSDWEQAFNSISRATGGEVLDNKPPAESLARFAETEDVYYRLTYAPDRDGGFTRKINVKTADRKLVLRFNTTVTLKAADELAIEGVTFEHPSLNFTIKHYRQLFDGARLAGDVDVKITVIDDEGASSGVNRNFTPEEEGTSISMKLNFPHGGEYSLIIESLDKHTGNKALFSRKVTAPRGANELDPDQPVLITPVHEAEGDTAGADLDAILARAGRYCDKLKKATFYFTCKEEIADSYTIKGKKVKNDIYRFDYQIVMDKAGKLNETRALEKYINKNDLNKDAGERGKKKKKKKPRKRKGKRNDEPGELVITNFYSRYPFLLPVTLLGREHRKRYEYRLLALEPVGDREAYKINVEPAADADGSKKAKPMNIGVVWVDAADGSVLKVQLDPRAVRGIDHMRKMARRKGAYLKITDLHHYDVQRSGIRFPSGTEISEIYLAARNTGDGTQSLAPLEEVKTVFSYKKYRFFNVNVDVVDSGHDN